MAIKLGNVVQAKVGTATYLTTSATGMFELPSGAMPIGVKVFGVASDATTTGVLTLRNVPQDTGTAAIFAVIDVKTAAGSEGTFAVVYSNASFTRLPVRNMITATYTETGTAAAAGSWTVVVEYL